MAEQFVTEHKARFKDWMTRQMITDVVYIAILVFAIFKTMDNSKLLVLVCVVGAIGIYVSALKNMKLVFGSLKTFRTEASLANAYTVAKQAIKKGNNPREAEAALKKAEQDIENYLNEKTAV